MIALQVMVVAIVILSKFSLELLSSNSGCNGTEKKSGCVDWQNGSLTKNALSYTINYNSSELNVKLIELQSSKNNTKCVEIFFQQYKLFCEATLVPRAGWAQLTNFVTAGNRTGQRQQQLERCPCIPRHKLSKQR
jgi:hypothetical protein